MKQYIKNKPIKWGFKWWCMCESKTGYLYQFDLYLGKNSDAALGVRESVVLFLSRKLIGSHCALYFDNFFNSPTLIQMLFDDKIYGIGEKIYTVKFF